MSDLVRWGERLEILCCGHDCVRRVFWAPEEAVARLGPECTFVRATARLVCGACGRRGRDRLVECRPSIEDFYARPPDERRR